MTDTDTPTQAEIAKAIYCHAPYGPGNPCDVDCKCEAHFNAIVDLLSSRPAPSEPRIDPCTCERCAKVTDKQTQDLRDLISRYPGSSAALTWEIAAQHCEACSVTIRSLVTDGRPARCPTCDSPELHLHPAMQYGGEVQPCRDSWHRPPQSSPPAGEGYWKKRLSLAKAEIERMRADQSSPPAGEGGIELCTYGPPRERKRYWILRFEDADAGDMHFTDETEAHAAFSRYEDAWTCTLFVTASNRPQSSPPAGEGEIEALRAALKQIVAEADSDDGLTAWDGADIARAALRRAHAPAAEDAIATLTAERDDVMEQLALRSPSNVERDMQAVMAANNELLVRAETAERAAEGYHQRAIKYAKWGNADKVLLDRLTAALTKISQRYPCTTADDMGRVATEALPAPPIARERP